MSESEDAPISSGPKVVAKFKSSSTKGGVEAYELTVTDAAGEGDVLDTVALARKGREQMLSAINGSEDLVKSVEAVQITAEEGAWERDLMRDSRA